MVVLKGSQYLLQNSPIKAGRVEGLECYKFGSILQSVSAADLASKLAEDSSKTDCSPTETSCAHVEVTFKDGAVMFQFDYSFKIDNVSC